MTTESRTVRATSPATDIALVATFAAFIAACALLPAVPVAGLAVPITLQTFAVAVSGAVLGARRGFFAVLLYLVVGFAGAPVFAGATGGLATLGRPSIGYLLAFPLAAAVTGLLTERWYAGRRKRAGGATFLAVLGAAVAGAIGVVYLIGVPVLAWRAGLTLPEAIGVNWVFLPGDVIKCVLTAAIATAVHRAFPDLLRR